MAATPVGFLLFCLILAITIVSAVEIDLGGSWIVEDEGEQPYLIFCCDSLNIIWIRA
jgi:hypothetical protein